jgi:hypothetical protein
MPGRSPINDAAKSENFWFARNNPDSLPLSQNWQRSFVGKADEIVEKKHYTGGRLRFDPI